MEFERCVTITLVGEVNSYLRATISHRTGDEQWTVSLIDHDDNVGATGYFASEEEALAHMEGFFELAVPAYDKKCAKYGQMPVIKLRNGQLAMEIDDGS